MFLVSTSCFWKLIQRSTCKFDFNTAERSDVSDQSETLTGLCASSSLQVKVLFAGQDIDRSPFMVHVSKAMGDPTRVQARGPGLQATGNVANKPTYFDIYTAGKPYYYCVLTVRPLAFRQSCNNSAEK